MNRLNTKPELAEYTKLHFIASRGTYSQVLHCLEKYSNYINKIDEHYHTPLHYAIEYNQPIDIIKLLLSSGAHVNVHFSGGDETALHTSVGSNNYNLVKLLLDNNANVNIRTSRGETPLHRACINNAYNRVKIVYELIKHGANIEARDKDGLTPLMYAARANNVNYINALMLNKAYAYAQDNEGNTALHYAAQKKDIEGKSHALRFLLRRGVDPNIRNKEGLTPLHLAAYFENQHAIYLLKDYGASRYIRNNEGITPLYSIGGPSVSICINLMLNEKYYVREEECW